MDYGTVIELYRDKHNEQVEFAGHYGEPGYSDPEKGIVFANWNNIPKRIADGLEAQGYELEWSDEWHIDYNKVKQSEDYESGLHPGQTDSPQKIAAALVAAGKEYLFQIGGVGQFDVRFHVWVRE